MKLKNIKTKIIAGALTLSVFGGLLTGCDNGTLFGGPSSNPDSAGGKKTINVYSTAEDFRNENARNMLKEKFPEYKINLIDISTGSLSAKLAAETPSDTDIDIILELETSYLERFSDKLATLDSVDFSVYLDEYVPASHKYTPWIFLSGAVIVNKTMLAEKGAAIPTSYDDLLKPEYKGLISMPNPKTSGTGYIFLLNLVNARGQDAAFEYFDKLTENIAGQGYPTSGSGPINALVQREAAIGLGMTFQAVTENNKGSDFEIIWFDEGAPYCTYSSAVIEGKEKDEDVMKVFNYIVSDVSPADKKLFFFEKVFKEQETTVKNYPENIKYGDMKGLNDMDLKESLLDKWNH